MTQSIHRTPSRSAAVRRRRGFTLAEMMIVISVMSLMLAIAGPKLNRTMLQANVRSASVELQARLALARQVAIRRGSGAVLHVSANKAWVDVDQNGGPVILRDTLFLADKYGVALSYSGADSVRYDARGYATLTADQTFSVSKSSISQTVCVTAAGLLLSGGCTL
jgi:type IV fimbrial biogenesis protein FimT